MEKECVQANNIRAQAEKARALAQEFCASTEKKRAQTEKAHATIGNPRWPIPAPSDRVVTRFQWFAMQKKNGPAPPPLNSAEVGAGHSLYLP
jgi:hypothetical protein